MDIVCPVGSIPYIIRRGRLLSPVFYLILSRPDSFKKPARPYLSTVPVFAGHLLAVYKMDMACPVPGPSKNISRVSRLPAAVRPLYHKGSGRFPGPSGNKKRRFLAGFRKKTVSFPGGGKDCRRWSRIFRRALRFLPPFPLCLEK